MRSTVTTAPPGLDELRVNTLRFLAVDAVPKEKSGHLRLGKLIVLADSPSGAGSHVILIATGSEPHLALEVRDRLATEGVQARSVSLPGTDDFSTQPDRYREEVLPPGVAPLAIEAGASLGWRSYVGPQIAVIGVDTFGASAPGPVLMRHYGSAVENVCERAHDLLGRVEVKR
jgi:transketolase